MLYLIGLSYVIVLIVLIHSYSTRKIEGDPFINFAAFLLSPIIVLFAAIDFLIDTFKKYKNKQLK